MTDSDLVLFDSWLGLPLPGPDGKRPATLAEVTANDANKTAAPTAEDTFMTSSQSSRRAIDPSTPDLHVH